MKLGMAITTMEFCQGYSRVMKIILLKYSGVITDEDINLGTNFVRILILLGQCLITFELVIYIIIFWSLYKYNKSTGSSGIFFICLLMMLYPIWKFEFLIKSNVISDNGNIFPLKMAYAII